MARIEIIIDENGNVQIENFDTIGPGCTGVADKIALALGEQQQQDLKQEYYEVPIPDFAEVSEE